MSKLFKDKDIKKLLGTKLYNKIKGLFDETNEVGFGEPINVDIQVHVNDLGERVYTVKKNNVNIYPIGTVISVEELLEVNGWVKGLGLYDEVEIVGYDFTGEVLNYRLRVGNSTASYPISMID